MPATPKAEDKTAKDEKKAEAKETIAAKTEEKKEAAAEKKEAAKAKKPAPKKSNDLEIPDDAYVNWQLYRSKQQIYASILDADASVEGKKGKAGDYIAYDGDKYLLLTADDLTDYQPITPTERAKA